MSVLNEKAMRRSLPNVFRHIPVVHGLGAVYRRARTHAIERFLRIDTVTLPPQEHDRSEFPTDCFRYDTIDYRLLRRVINRLELRPYDVAYELGCGLGRIVCVLARQRIHRSIGIELSPALARRAEQNIASLRGRRAEAEIRIQDAAEANYDDGTVFVLFNPFGERILAAVLEQIHDSLLRSPRSIRMAYILPRRDFLMEQADWLRSTGSLNSAWFGINVSFWTNTPDTALRLAA